MALPASVVYRFFCNLIYYYLSFCYSVFLLLCLYAFAVLQILLREFTKLLLEAAREVFRCVEAYACGEVHDGDRRFGAQDLCSLFESDTVDKLHDRLTREHMHLII